MSRPAGTPAGPSAAARRRARTAIAWQWLAGVGLGLVIGIQLMTRTPLSGPGALLVELGRWTGLIGTYGALLVIVLVARVPSLERAVGLDRLMAWHRRLGPAVLVLIGAHVVLITAGYASGEATSYLAQTVTFLVEYPWALPAAAGLALMLVAGVSSWRVARRRMRYETWWVTHLYFYLAIALAYAHQVLLGQQFVDHEWARRIWIALYVVTLGVVLVFRVVHPLWRSVRHDIRVHAIVRESPDTVSIWLSGRRLDRLEARGGQFFGLRFLTREHWWQSHPYSLSAGPDPRYLRVTVKDLGDHSSAMAALPTGTRVVAEGPYGVFTADARHSDRVVLVAGGVGVTPLRALIDDLPHDAPIDLLYRAPRADALVLRTELEALAAVRPRLRIRYLVGSRRDYPITARSLQWLVPDIAGADVYTCGPGELVVAVREAALTAGVPEERIHDEGFSFHSPATYSRKARA